MHKVILIPGLGDEIGYLKNATRNWKRYGLEVIIVPLHWRDGEHFKTKLHRLRDLVDAFSKENNTISVIGCSAGGSAALNLFIEQNNVVYRAVNVCGRIREGNQTGFRSFQIRTKTSVSFAESVKLFESHESSLTNDQRARIMTIRPLFGDQLVPASTTVMDGAYNLTVPTIEHNISIYIALSLCSRQLIKFLMSS